MVHKFINGKPSLQALHNRVNDKGVQLLKDLIQAAIVAKSPRTLSTFYSALKFHPPPSPKRCCFFLEEHGKFPRAQQCQVSHRRNNIVLGGVGIRVRRKYEEVERTMVFNHFL